MTVTRTAAGNAQVALSMFDGTPGKRMQGPAGQEIEVISTSKWEGDVLVTTTSAPLVTYIERRWLQADGTMRVELTINFTKEPKSESGVKVFNRVK